MYMYDTTHAYQYILYKSYSPIHLPEDLGMAFSHRTPPKRGSHVSVSWRS